MVLGYNNDDGAQALDQQQEIDFRRGWQVVDAAGGSNLVTAGTGSYDVDVAAGDINTPSGTVTCSGATLDLQSLVDPDLPRIVLVYRDASGVAQTLAGTPAAKQPEGETAPGPIYQPAPDAFSTTDGVVLATVLLEAAASSVGSAQIRDRRMPASLNVDSAEVGTLNADDQTINQSVTDPAGVSHTSEIADEANTFPKWEVVASKNDFGGQASVSLTADISPYTEIMIRAGFGKKDAGVLSAVVNNNTTTNYDYLLESDSGITSATGQTQFDLINYGVQNRTVQGIWHATYPTQEFYLHGRGAAGILSDSTLSRGKWVVFEEATSLDLTAENTRSNRGEYLEVLGRVV